jgi:hypothetical protein
MVNTTEIDTRIIAVTAIAGLLIGGVLLHEAMKEDERKKNTFANVAGNGYPQNALFYGQGAGAKPLSAFRGPQLSKPGMDQNVSLQNSGSQLLAYQIYQQGVNAATPTMQQLDAISGQSQEQTGYSAAQLLGGGLSSGSAPYNMLSDQGQTLFGSEFQAVNYGNEQAQSISACAQNAPTFVATSLLPKPAIPGQQAWDIGAPNGILANQNFLSATQQIGVDTVLGSTRNQSRDIRNTIPNPINVVSPWNNTELLPDLERRPLDCFVQPGSGLYGCGAPQVGANQNGTFVGM